MMPDGSDEIKFAISCDIAMSSSRTALLIRCSKEEAGMVRAQANAERRTISGCILNIVERGISMERQYARGITKSFFERQARQFRLAHRVRDHATILLRCSVDEADRIRATALSRGMSISEFVGFSLWRHWEAADKIRRPKIPEQPPTP